MAAVYYRCFSCDEYFYTKEDAGQHVSNCSKGNDVQIGESSQAEVLEPLVPYSQAKPTQEVEETFEIAEDTCADEKTVFVWNRAATLLLIKLYEQHEMKFHSGNYKKKMVWQMIASEVKAAGYRVTTLQCENRWKTLMSSYRKTKFLNQLSGNKKTCNFFSELDALVKTTKRTMSVGILRRRLGEPSTPGKTKRKVITKMEDSGTADLCEILKKMEERSEKRHQERMALQREMMDSHKQLMQTILNM